MRTAFDWSSVLSTWLHATSLISPYTGDVITQQHYTSDELSPHAPAHAHGWVSPRKDEPDRFVQHPNQAEWAKLEGFRAMTWHAHERSDVSPLLIEGEAGPSRRKLMDRIAQ